MCREDLVSLIIELLKSEKLIKKEKLVKDEVEIFESTSLANDVGLSSIDIIELVVLIEDKLGLEFDDSDLLLMNFDNVSVIADLILKRFYGYANLQAVE